jgi:hypothetical protein
VQKQQGTVDKEGAHKETLFRIVHYAAYNKVV